MAAQEESAHAAPGIADQRRGQMLRAALDVITERGFADTRIADIAERIGISPALVIYYFKTKDQLLTEAIRHYEDTWYTEGKRRMDKLATAAERLEGLVGMNLLPGPNPEPESTWKLGRGLGGPAARDADGRGARERVEERDRSRRWQTVKLRLANGMTPVAKAFPGPRQWPRRGYRAAGSPEARDGALACSRASGGCSALAEVKDARARPKDISAICPISMIIMVAVNRSWEDAVNIFSIIPDPFRRSWCRGNRFSARSLPRWPRSPPAASPRLPRSPPDRQQVRMSGSPATRAARMSALTSWLAAATPMES